jgi:hypothetical protein
VLFVEQMQLIEEYERLFLESPAEISGFGVFHDLPRVADSLQIASDDFIERRSFRACDLDDPVSRISEGASPHGIQRSGSVAEGCPGAHLSGGLPHCRPLTVVDNVPPESIRAPADDIACRASKVNIVVVGTFASN